jgi:choline-sulfatase
MVRGSVLSVAMGMLVLVGLGCDKGDEAEEGAAASGASETPKGAGAAAPEGPVLEAHRTHLDLMALVHLADVDHHGLYVDFGTPARMKYTVGHWRTQWGSDGSSGDTTFTYAGGRGRVYFDVPEPGPLTVRMRLRPVGTGVMSPYLNGEGLEAVRFQEGSDFRDYDLTIPEERVRAGENELMLVFGGTTAVGQEKVSVAMESVRIARGTSMPGGDAYVPPSHDALVGEVEVGKQRRRAIAVRTPTTLAYHVHVPAKAKLAFAAGHEGEGEARVRVTATPAVGASKQLLDAPAGASWKSHVVDLGDYADQVVRLELRAEGEAGGRLAFAEPVVAVPEVSQKKLAQAKNVVVLLIDTLRADKLKPFNPKTRVKTPHLDAVADEGTVFALAQSPENWTKPSVASILTSLYPASHGAKQDTSRLPDSALMLSEHYKANGFSTATFLANGYVSDKFGFKQGWDHYTNYIREGRVTEAGNVFKEAGEWIEKHHGDGRFFVYIQTIDPHVPYDPPGEFLEMYDARDYGGQVKPRMTPVLLERAKKKEITFDASDKRRLEALHDGEISYHDNEMGKFIERMKALGLWDDTLFVITSDHGEEFNDHGSWGHGHSTYQELLHVPLLFRQPGAVPAETTVSTVVSTIDIAPTVLELSGTPPMPAAEGVSLAGYFQGQPPARPAVAFSDFLDDRRVITTGRWKLVLRGLTADFFDLQEDPGEQKVLHVTQYPIAMRYCRVMLGQFLGAKDRARWLEGEQREGVALESEEADMDDTIREQLKALGYAN